MLSAAGFGGGAFGDEFFGGELNGVVPGVVGVEGAGELKDGEVMAEGDGELFDEEVGVRSDNGGAEQMPGFVGDDFDETVRKTIDFAGGDVRKLNNGLFVFAFATDELGLVCSDCGDHGVSVGEARNILVFDESFTVANKVGGESGAFAVSAFGGGIAADAIADGVDVFGGSLEEFVNGDARRGIFDLGVFETII